MRLLVGLTSTSEPIDEGKECRMSAPKMKHKVNLNHLRRGGVYRAVTTDGFTLGEYLGVEAIYGERAVMLRSQTGTASLLRGDILSIELAA